MPSIKVAPAPLTRPLSQIAGEIGADWGDKLTKLGPDWGFGPVQHPARPYWDAMRTLNTADLGDGYYTERADMVVRYFLGNAGQWRGPVAQRVKTELKAALADFDKDRRR